MDSVILVDDTTLESVRSNGVIEISSDGPSAPVQAPKPSAFSSPSILEIRESFVSTPSPSRSPSKGNSANILPNILSSPSSTHRTPIQSQRLPVRRPITRGIPLLTLKLLAARSLPAKLFVSDSSALNSATRKDSQSYLKSLPTKFQLSTPKAANKNSNILDFGNWFSESEANSSLVQSSPKVASETIKSSTLSRPLASAALTDPIESNSSSPFKHAPPAKKRKVKAKVTPTLPPSDIKYDLKALNEANKTNRTKDELLSSMILYVPPTLLNSDYARLKFAKSKLRLTTSSSNSSNVFWSRLVAFTYMEQPDLYVPCIPKEIPERNLLVYLSAEELVSKVQDNSIEAFLQECVDNFKVSISIPVPSVILLVEGYDKYISKLKANQDRLFKEQVRNELAAETNVRKRKSKAKETGLNVDIPVLEKLLTRIQFKKSVNVFHTKSLEDTIDWLHSFTYTIASSYYESSGRISARVKSGTDAKSTFLRSLQQFKFITEVKAEKAYLYYQSLQSIHRAINQNGTLGKTSEGSNIVPPTTDLALKTFFTSTDPDEVLE